MSATNDDVSTSVKQKCHDAHDVNAEKPPSKSVFENLSIGSQLKGPVRQSPKSPAIPPNLGDEAVKTNTPLSLLSQSTSKL